MPQVAIDPEVELQLLRRRLARAEAACAQAEQLLEDKSRVLALANLELSANKELLSNELNQKTRQLLDAQRVAGFGTMIWDMESGKGELSPNCQTMLGLSGSLELSSISALMRRVLDADRERLVRWARVVQESEQKAMPEAAGSKRPEGFSRSDPDKRAGQQNDMGIELRIAGPTSADPNRMIRLMGQAQFDQRLGRSLVYLTLQDVTREVEAANEAAALRQLEQRRIEELEALNLELRQTREAAEKANAAKTRFLAMMSHDIRTPLNGVIGMLSLFDEGDLSPAQLEALELVRASSDQLRMLLDDIIDLERAEAGKLVLNPMPLEVSMLLSTSTKFWGKAARDKGLSLELVRGAFGWEGPPPQWVMADRYRLRQIVDNLLSNAIKYTRQGGIKVRVGLVGASRMRFEVVDTGIGIPAERSSDLFEDFGQLHADGTEPGGAGLGLAICRRIVALMDGEIGVQPGPDAQGSCFWVEIPFLEVAAQDQEQAKQPMVLKMLDGRRPKILVAEDIETNRIVARGLLGRLGCDVELVTDGEQAVQAVQRSAFDLVLMDVAMPIMNGVEATHLIRGLDGPLGAIPIVALTAYSQPEELQPMYDAGAQARINKPIVIDEMHRVINAVLREAAITGKSSNA